MTIAAAPDREKIQSAPRSQRAELHEKLTGRALYRACHLGGRFTWLCTMRIRLLRPELAEREGGYVIACTHLSHLEPFILAILLRRKMDWMTRVEFFGRWWSRWFLYRWGAFPVNRYGVPVSAIRTAIRRLGQGRVVGICPEGGVAIGAASACRGAEIKRGVGLVAYRANVPVVPCVMIGTHELNRVGPWLPFRRGRLWVAFGEPIEPDRTLASKAAREKLTEELQRRFAALFTELCEEFGVAEGDVP